MIIEKSRNNSLYRKIFLRITAVIVSIAILSGIGLSIFYSRLFIRAYIERDIEQLQITDQYYRNYLYSVRSTGSVIITDSDFQKLLYDEELSSREISSILQKMKNILVASPYIEFFNFYLPRKNIYYSSNTKQRESGHPFPEVKPEAFLPENIQNFSPIPMTVKLDTANKVFSPSLDMLIFIMPISPQPDSPFLALYIDIPKLSRIFRAERDSETIILDKNGIIVCHSDFTAVGSHYGTLSINKEIDACLKGKDWHIYGNILRRDMQILSSLQTEGYTIFKRSTLMPFVSSVLLMIRNSLVIIGAIIVIIFITASRILRKLYSPIQTLLSRLHQADNFREEEKTDLELLQFLNSEAESVSNIDSLRRFREKNQNLVRNRHLFSFLNSKLESNDPAATMEMIQREGFPFNDSCHYRIIYCAFRQQWGDYYSSLLLRELIQHYFGQDYTVATCNGEDNHYISILAGDQPFILDRLRDDCMDFQIFLKSEKVKSFDHLSYMSISAPCRGYRHLPEAYSALMVQNGFSYKEELRTILTPEITKTVKVRDPKYPISQEALILKYLRNHNVEQGFGVLEDFFASIYDFDPVSAFNFVMRFASSLAAALQEIERKSHMDFSFHFNNWYRNIIKAENLIEVKHYISSLLNHAQEQFDLLKTSKTEHYTAAIKSIIDESYGDPNLSIQSLADRISLSPAYLGQIFKKRYSLSIPEYVLKVRLNRAKELIKENPDKKINEISQAVGIQNYRYFYTKFKQNIGITPGSFRHQRQSL